MVAVIDTSSLGTVITRGFHILYLHHHVKSVNYFTKYRILVVEEGRTADGSVGFHLFLGELWFAHLLAFALRLLYELILQIAAVLPGRDYGAAS